MQNDVKKIKKMIDRHEADLADARAAIAIAEASAKQLHEMLYRMADRNKDALGFDVKSVIPKNPNED